MSSKHLVDPDLAALADWPLVSFDSTPIATVRAQRATMAPPRPAPSPDGESLRGARAGPRRRAGRAAGGHRAEGGRRGPPGHPARPRRRLCAGLGGDDRPDGRDLRQPAGRGGGLGRLSPGAGDATSRARWRTATPAWPGCMPRPRRWASTRAASWSPARAPAAGWRPRWCCWRATAANTPIAFQHLVFPMLDDRTVTHPDPVALSSASSSGAGRRTASAGPRCWADRRARRMSRRSPRRPAPPTCRACRRPS